MSKTPRDTLSRARHRRGAIVKDAVAQGRSAAKGRLGPRSLQEDVLFRAVVNSLHKKFFGYLGRPLGQERAITMAAEMFRQNAYFDEEPRPTANKIANQILDERGLRQRR